MVWWATSAHADRGGEAFSGVFSRFLRALIVSSLLSGCLAKRSGYDVPSIPLPAQFKNEMPLDDSQSVSSKRNAEAEKSARQQPEPSGETAGFEDWWRAFGSAELDALINRGLANNQDVKIATIRMAQAKARADQAQAGLSPSLSMPTLAARQAPGGTVGTVPIGSSGRAPQNAFQGSLKGEFRLDIWGEQSSLAESAQLQLWRAAYERDNVQRNVAANIVSGYVEYVTLNDRLRVARETERVLSSTLSTLQRRLELGDMTLADLEQQKALIYGLRAAIPGIEQQREDVLNSLAFLVGTVPGGLKLSEQGLASLTVPSVVPGLPSSLLLRRPDVRMAEARLLAADADIDVARTRILPPVDLAAQAGYSSNMLAQLFQPRFFFWNTIASMTTSIFDGGRREGEKKFSEAMYEEMVESYARTIYQGMREVEGALATIRLAGRRLDAQQEAADAARRAWEINSRVYAMGAVDQTTLLESERNFHRYLDEYQKARMEHLRGYTALFLALGGGVRTAAPTPGEGKRPSATLSGKILGAAKDGDGGRAVSVDGLDFLENGTGKSFWQIELPGLYHRSAVGAAWRDLRTRYPVEMQGRMVRPRLNGRIGAESGDSQESWYKLFVAGYRTAAEAKQFCKTLLANQERCRVVDANGKEADGLSERSEQGASGQGPDKDAVEKAVPKPSLPSQDLGAAPVEVDRGRSEQIAHTLQLGAYSNLENAAIAHAVWEFRGYETYVAETKGNDGRVWYALRTGLFSSRQEAAAAALKLRKKEDAPAVIVPTVLGEAGQPLKVDIADVLTPVSGVEPPILPEPPEVVSEKFALGSAGENPVPSPVRLFGQGKPYFSVQLAAFSSLDNAEVARRFWQGRGHSVHVAVVQDAAKQSWYAVRSGNFVHRRDAVAAALMFGRKEKVSAIVVTAAVDAPDKPEMITNAISSPGQQATGSHGGAEVSSMALAKGGHFAIQLGVFGSIENAAKSFADWQLRGYEPYVCDAAEMPGQPRFAVRTGDFASKREAQSMLRIIERQESVRGIVVPVLLDKAGELSRIDVTPLLPASSLTSSFTTSGSDVR